MIKVEIIDCEGANVTAYEYEISRFIKRVDLVDIKYSIAVHNNDLIRSVMVMYKEKK